jgi:hypothetical protein
MYAVVFFSERKEVEAVPSSWICPPSFCYWPPFKAQEISSLIKNNTPPCTKTWPKCAVRKILYYGNNIIHSLY